MKFTRNGSVQLIAGAILGASVVVVACGGDDSTGTSTPTDGGASDGASSSGATSSSGGSSGTASSSGGSSGTTSGDGGGGDGGGGEGGAKKANGDGPCAGDAECLSGVCFIGGKESYCTVKCTKIDDTDPVCEALGAKFSGDCNKKGFCSTN